MIISLAFCAKDKAGALRLARWIAELGGVEKHDCLLGVHKDTDSSEIIDVMQGAFRRVAEVPIDEDATIYPFIANKMWERMARHIAMMNESAPWLWLEWDAVPLVPDWLDKIEAEYVSAKKPFMLDKVVTPTSVHNSGVGVYPADVMKFTNQLWNLANVPWDVFFKDDFTPHTHHTGLIHDLFYLHLLPNADPNWPRDTAPTFPDASWLSIIEPGAVLFHRDKSGTLMERLRERAGANGPKVSNLTPGQQRQLERSQFVGAFDQAVNGLPENITDKPNPLFASPELTEASAIDFLTERAKRSGIDKGRITKRLSDAGFALSEAKPKKRVRRKLTGVV